MMSEEFLKETLIFDIESRNHLEKDCVGDFSKLELGLAGIKILGKDKFLFFDESNINDLKNILTEADGIVGFNLVGHNGLDYKILKNYGICVESLIPKTFDLMTVMIRAFGSYKNMNLNNISEHTLGIKKKKINKSNYKLIQNKQFEKVKENLKHELVIIECLLITVLNGGIVRFKTPSGLIDEHELPPLGGIFPEFGEEIIQPYDFPVGGMRLQIKDKIEEVVKCNKCNLYWRITSVSYYGDTMPDKIYCPDCDSFLIQVKSNLFGEQTKIRKKQQT